MGKKPYEFIQNGKHLSHNDDLIPYQRTKNIEQIFVQSNKEYKECGKAFHEPAVVIPYNQAYIGQSPCEHNVSDKTFCSNSTLMVSRMAQRTKNLYEFQEYATTFEKSSLLEHRVHLEVKGYEYIGRVDNFNGISDFLGTGERIFEYNNLGEPFGEKSVLNITQRTHIGGKVYECNECGKTFCKESKLTKHQKTHTREKSMNVRNVEEASTISHISPYTREFTQGRSHMNVINVEKPL